MNINLDPIPPTTKVVGPLGHILVAFVLFGAVTIIEARGDPLLSYRVAIISSAYQEKDHYDVLTQGLPDAVVRELLLAQLIAESSLDPDAVSERGAMGIAQFMPDTWEMFGRGDPFNPKDAIPAQIRYMSYLYQRFAEIADPIERYKFALAAYISGPANINRALANARESLGLPAGHNEWLKVGVGGRWQKWVYTSQFLYDVISEENAYRVIEYVDKIFSIAAVNCEIY